MFSNKRWTYVLISTSGYMAGIDRKAEDMFFQPGKQIEEQEGVVEQLKLSIPFEGLFVLLSLYGRRPL